MRVGLRETAGADGQDKLGHYIIVVYARSNLRDEPLPSRGGTTAKTPA